MTALLQIDDVHAHLGGRPVLHGVSLSLGAASFTGLLGPNGAGKTTLLRRAAGLQPGAGKVQVMGHDMDRLAPRARARICAFLPQEREIGWPLAVEALVDLGRAPARPYGRGPSAEDRAATRRAMEQTGVLGFADRPATELSGGERARVLIARALAQETPLLLADEPASGLDPAHRIALMACFRSLARAGRGVLASFHDLGLAARWCDRVVILHEGRVWRDGTPEQALDAASLQEIYGIRAFLSRDDEGMLLVPTGASAGADP